MVMGVNCIAKAQGQPVSKVFIAECLDIKVCNAPEQVSPYPKCVYWSTEI